MASNNNSDNSGAAVVFGLIAATMMFLAIMVYLFFIAVAAFLSVLCVVALFTPVKIGKLRIEEKQARWFLWRGLGGVFLASVIVPLLAPTFDIVIREDMMIHINIIGYLLGSLGGEWLVDKLGAYDEEAPVQAPPPVQQTAKIDQAKPEPFRFASWDDEDIQR